MNKHVLVTLSAAATLALASCGEAPKTPEFVRKAAMSDLYQVAAGKIAGEKGQSDAVKQFGVHMVEAHEQTLEELQSIVQTEKLDVVFPSRLGRRYHEMIVALTDAKPEDFDRVYASQQVKVHKGAAALFDAYAEDGNNPALKQFAANVLPAIKQHLEQAEKLVP
jgi:putative membrane protein